MNDSYVDGRDEERFLPCVIIGSIVGHLGGAQKRIQLRQTALFYKADTDYGRRVAKGLKLDEKELESLAKNVL